MMSGMVITPKSVTHDTMAVKYSSTRNLRRMPGGIATGSGIVRCALRTKPLPMNDSTNVPIAICMRGESGSATPCMPGAIGEVRPGQSAHSLQSGAEVGQHCVGDRKAAGSKGLYKKAREP